MAATLDLELVKKRGHQLPEGYPFAVDSKLEIISKAKDAKKIFENLGLGDELKRVSKRNIRPGKGKSRGRKYKCKKGPLFIVSSNCKLIKSCSSMPGIDVVNVKCVNAELLAPGAHLGRLTFFTDKAIEIIEKENLFM